MKNIIFLASFFPLLVILSLAPIANGMASEDDRLNSDEEETSNPKNDEQDFHDESIEPEKAESESSNQAVAPDDSMEQKLGSTMNSSTKGIPAELLEEIEAAIRKQVQEGLIFTNRNLSASDLRDLNRVLENSSVRRANEIMHHIIESPLGKLMKNAEKEL